MGLRLDGEPLPVPPEMASEPVCPGAVQVTRDGRCIVLGVDGQTIGGYPKVAQVVAADLDLLGQLRPGTAVVFRAVSLDEAARMWHQRCDDLAGRVLRLHETLALALRGP
jgi:antagonist of KipI